MVKPLADVAIGWYEENGKRYYKGEDGFNKVGWFTAYTGQRCYADANGEIKQGLIQFNGYTYYLDFLGAKQTGYISPGDGKLYYAYNFGGIQTTQGWFTTDTGNRSYAGVNGEIKEGFIQSNGYTYYVDSYGIKQTGYFFANDGKQYYAYGFGGVQTGKGWFTADNGDRCYARENGEIRFGFVQSNGYTYYVSYYGVKQTGYLTIGGKKYYAHGFGGVETKQGWFTADNGDRCYAGVNGEIKEGFIESNGYTYYVNNNGVKQTGYLDGVYTRPVL